MQRNSTKAWQCVSLGLWLLMVPAALAQETAQEWFQKMGHALENINYRGTFVHSHDNQIEIMDVLHKVEDGKVFERMTTRSGAPREFIRVGEEVQCIVKSRKEVMVDLWQNQNPIVATLPVYSEKLEQSYHFERLNNEHPVMGRETVGIAIVPKDNYRYGYRLFLDKETGMPLICDSYDNNGRLIESLHFTAIEFNPEFEALAFEPTLDIQDYRWIKPHHQRQSTIDGENKWAAKSMPNGFSLSISRVEKTGEVEVEHYVYSDGIASVSVFAEPRSPGQAVMNGAKSLGITNAFGRLEGDVQITVVGEVPVETVKFIGNSFAPRR